MMNVRPFPALLALVAALLLMGCGGKPSPEKVVAATAKLYYEDLLKGSYDDFVAGIDNHFPASGTYREQLRDNAKMFVARQAMLHQGIDRIEVADATLDEKNHSANVFLVLCYADSTNEQIVVPMVERDGIWLMR